MSTVTCPLALDGQRSAVIMAPAMKQQGLVFATQDIKVWPVRYQTVLVNRTAMVLMQTVPYLMRPRDHAA